MPFVLEKETLQCLFLIQVQNILHWDSSTLTFDGRGTGLPAVCWEDLEIKYGKDRVC